MNTITEPYRHYVQVGATEASGRHPDEDVILLVELRDGNLVEREFLRVGVEAQGLHHLVHRVNPP